MNRLSFLETFLCVRPTFVFDRYEAGLNHENYRRVLRKLATNHERSVVQPFPWNERKVPGRSLRTICSRTWRTQEKAKKKEKKKQLDEVYPGPNRFRFGTRFWFGPLTPRFDESLKL